MYVVVYDDSNPDWIASQSFTENIDYEIDDINAMFKRIQTADGGTIPAPADETDPLTLRILYVKDETINDHYQNTVYTFSSIQGQIAIQLSTIPNTLYPNKEVEVWDKKMETKYERYNDFTIDYETSLIVLTSNSDIANDETVLVFYADDWRPDSTTAEENMYLEFIKDKKMLCVDNHIKDAVYSTYDIVMTIYTYKNMTNNVKNNIYTYIRNQFNIEKQSFGDPISKSEISAYAMTYPGVRLAEVTYLGKDYVAYQKYLFNEITLEDIKEIQADNVEYTLEAKYNEILVLSHDVWDGVEVIENKKHGLIIDFQER
jgi:hypothetical protein